MDALQGVSWLLPVPSSLDDMTPQHWGVVAGCIVYVLTVAVVLVLMVAGGTCRRLREQEEVMSKEGKEGLTRRLYPKPLLYDDLLEASKKLPGTPRMPTGGRLTGRFVVLQQVEPSRDCHDVFLACNGSTAMSYPKVYDPMEIWMYSEHGPFASEEDLRASSLLRTSAGRLACKVLDAETGKVVGMACITSNAPHHLRAGLGDLWFNPGHADEMHMPHRMETVYLLLRLLFGQLYRKVEWRMDYADPRMKEALAIGFVLEGTLRKDMIVRDRNRDTAVLGTTNSDWNGGAGGGQRVLLEREIYGRKIAPEDLPTLPAWEESTDTTLNRLGDRVDGLRVRRP
jgi:RimJ/RimL family protein N-acetyltransferase